MALGPLMLFLGMVAVVGGLPLWFATLRPQLRTTLLYGHLGVLQLLRGFLLATYVMPLGGGVAVSPNHVMYAGLMMTALVLVLVERRTAVLRTVILLLLGTEAIKLAVFATTRWALGSPDFVNVLGVDPTMFGALLHVSFIGALLIIAQLLVVVAVLEQVRRRTDVPRVLSLWCVALYCAAVVSDGLLFPVLTQPLEPGLTAVITAGVVRKAVLAAAFGAPLLAFVLLRPEPIRRYLTTGLRLRDVLLAPRHRLIARIEDQEEERVALLERTVHVAEDERRRLAEDMHDDAIQLFTAADIHLQRIAAAAPGVDLGQIQDLLRSGVGSLRRLILELRGPEVTATSFEPLVRAYVEQMMPDGVPDVGLDIDLPPDAPEDIAAGAFRIVLEALSNAVQHARSGHVTVEVTVEDGLLLGRVADNGIGLPDDAETGPGHLGLRAMRDRADVLGGRVEVRAVTSGTVVSFALPVRPPDVSDPPRPARRAPGRLRRP